MSEATSDRPGPVAPEHLLAEKRRILTAALPDVPFDGWTQRLLVQAAQTAGFDAAMAARAFPGGTRDLLDFFMRETDRRMLEALAAQAIGPDKVRERIAGAIRLRLEGEILHREAIRKALAAMALPPNVPLALKGLYRTIDAIWYAAGDHDTDLNFYTKRLTLAGVYAATLTCWLDDTSEGQAQTWTFLDRRLNDVMSIGRLKKRLGGLGKNFPDPRHLLKIRL